MHQPFHVFCYRVERCRLGNIEIDTDVFDAGCPIVAVTVEAGDPDNAERTTKVIERAAAAFALWTDLIRQRLVTEGVDAARAEELAMLVTASIEGRSVIVRIQDTGIGIPENEQGELFTRFYRASNARKRAIPGTGLGLTIVRTIVANHGGEIELQTQENVGTVATVKLPLLAAPG